MVDESVAGSVRRYLRAVTERGIPVRYGIVFGSQVSGHPNTWSDIDLLVVSSRFDGERKREDIDLLWRIAARMDSRIEPIAVGECQFQEDDSSAIVEIARREGQMISLPA
jgi:predicted nucleotidyltransferase